MPKLTIDIVGQLVGFQDSLDKLVSQSQRAGNQVQRAFAGAKTAIGLLSTGLVGTALVSSFRAITDQAENFNKLAQKTGIATEALSTLSFAAKLADVDNETLATGLKKLAVNMTAAAGGAKEQGALFAALGVNVRTAEGSLKGTDALLRELADRFESFEDGPAKAALAVQLFGKSGDALIPFLNNLRASEREAQKFAAVFTGDFAKASEEFNDNVKRIAIVSEAANVAIVGKLLPAISSLIEQLLAASRAAESLVGGITLFFTISGKQAKEPEKAIGEIERKLVAVKEVRDALVNAGGLSRFFNADDIAIANTQIAVFEKQLQALKPLADSLRARQGADPKSPLFEFAGGGIKKEAPVVPQGPASDIAKKFADAEAKLAEARSKQELDSEQRFATARLRLLENFYSQGLIGTQAYFDERFAIQQEAAAKELKAIDAEIALRKRAVSDPKRDVAERKQAEVELVDALGRRRKVEEELTIFASENNVAAAKATRDYADAVAELNAKLAEQAGLTADALRIRQQVQNRSARDRFAADPVASAAQSAVERGELAQAEFNQTRERGAEITTRLAIAEERIQNTLRTGAISEFQAMQRTSDERQRAVAQQRAIADELERIGQSSGIKRLELQAEQFRVELERLAAQSDLLADKFDEIGQSSFATFLEEATSKTKTLSEAFKTMVDNISREISRLAGNEIASAALGGLKGATGGTGFGGFMADIFRGIFGGGGGGGGGGLNLSSFGMAFAAGGATAGAGQPFIVGERGPELFVPKNAGQIVPNGKFGAAGTQVALYQNFNGPVNQQSANQAGAAAARALRDFDRRNN